MIYPSSEVLKRRYISRLIGFCFIFLILMGMGRWQALGGGTVQDVNGTTLITLVIPGMPNMADSSPNARAQIAVIRQFERDFPKIFKERYAEKYKANPKKYGNHNWDEVAIRLVPFTGITVEGVESDLMAIAGGNAPDVLYINFRKSDNYIRNGFLYPLDKLDDQYFSRLSEEDLQRRVHPRVWDAIRRKGPHGQEHIWALPTGGFIGRVLAYRKELFDEANIPYPSAQWTWNDMLSAAQKLTDPERGRVGIAFSEVIGWDFITFLWSAGAEMMEYDKKTDEWRCVFGSDEGALALDFFMKLLMDPWTDSKGRLTRGYAIMDNKLGRLKWERGEVGMQLTYMDDRLLGSIDPDLVGLAPVPMGPGGNRGAELNSRMLGIFAGIEEVAIRDAAWEYIVFQDSDPALSTYTRILVEGGMGRFVNPDYLRRFGYGEIADMTPKGWLETFQIAMESGRPEPYGQNSNFAYRMLARPVDEAIQLALANKLPEDQTERLELLKQILVKGEKKANDFMIGKVSPKQRSTRNGVAMVFLFCIGVSFLIVFYRVFKTFSDVAVVVPRRPGTSRRTFIVFALLFPALISILLWRYYPLFMGSIMGFQDYRIMGDSTWVGLKHFGDILWDSLWWESLYNSLRFSFVSLVFGFTPPILLAILLQEVPKGKITYRLLFYLPAVLSGLVTLLLWKQFYDPSIEGTLNKLLSSVPAVGYFVVAGAVLFGCFILAQRFFFYGQKAGMVLSAFVGIVFAVTVGGIGWSILFPAINDGGHFLSRLFSVLPEPIHWLRDPRYSMISCIIPGIWAGMGPGCLIYLAALKGIPDDFYEASEIDGASFLDKILSVVIPTLRPLIIINFVGAFIGSWLNSTDTILVMTAGQANTEVAPLNIFYKAFVYLEYGPATAMAWILGFLLIGFTVYQLRILARVEFRAAGGSR